MRAVVQRVTQAGVTVDGRVTGEIACGLAVLLGVEKGDTESDVDYMVDKTVGLRIFEDEDGKMNLSLEDVGGSLLAVSQFTLLGDVRKGKRPSFTAAAGPEEARSLYELYTQRVRQRGIKVEEGIFRAEMLVKIYNDGPVTILLDSRKGF